MSPPPVRSWDLEVVIPPEHRDAVTRSTLSGAIDVAIRSERVNALLCALPKSASLYVTELLSRSLDLRNHQVGLDRRGGAVYWPRLLLAKYVGADTISHCHAAPDPTTHKMILALGLKPLVLTRNLLDALVSRRDMLLRDGYASNLLSHAAIERFRASDDEAQLDAVIDLFAPAFLNFAAGWSELAGDGRFAPTFLTYEELVRDEPAFVARAAAGLGRPCDPARVRAVSADIAAGGGVNRSRGVAGRGAATFRPRQIERLRALAELHGCADEAFLGFAAESAAAA